MALGGGLAGLVAAIVAASAAATASDDSASMKAESVTLRKIGYEARLAARAADQTPSPWQPAEVLRELSECGFEYFTDEKLGNRLDPARAAERLEAGQAELGTRVPRGAQDAFARAEEDLAELHRCSLPDELLPRARVLGRLLGALPRQHALNAFRAARHPVGNETIDERADLCVEHMLQETFTVRDRELESAPRALARTRRIATCSDPPLRATMGGRWRQWRAGLPALTGFPRAARGYPHGGKDLVSERCMTWRCWARAQAVMWRRFEPLSSI